MESSLRLLAGFAAGLRAENIPQNILSAAAERVLDNISVAVAASGDELVRSITNKYLALAGDKPAARIWGSGHKAPVLTAVFLNALMCHLLESDDVHTKSKAHIGATVVPAAWSLAEALGRSGKELLTAVIAGYEVESRIAMAFGVKEHRKLGWHVTATAGVFGAAAACGRLLELDEEHMVSCLGLAGSQSFGSWAFLGDGTNSKSLNPARAAASGCEAAILASAGMTGPEHILDAEDGGLLRMMTDHAYYECLTAGLGEVWEICDIDNKTYPCCRSTHCAIDSALALREREQIDPAAIEQIVISTYQIGKQQCATSPACLEPHNSVEAKFSAPYCVAAALIKGKVSLDEFEETIIETPEIQELLKKVKVGEEERFTQAYPNHWGCHTEVFCRDGKRYENEIRDASGSIYNPLTKDQSRSKAVNMLSRAYPDRAEATVEKLLCLDELSLLPEL